MTQENTQEDLKKEAVEPEGAGQPLENEGATESPAEDTAEAPVSQDDSEGEKESVADLRARLARAEADRDNYKKGMLSAKAKKRSLEPTIQSPSEEAAETPEPVDDETDPDTQKVLLVLNRERERHVLSDVIDMTSKNYMPELVDDRQYNEIVGYLPKSIDRSSEESIRRALRVAIHAWKFDHGITDKKPKTKPEAKLATTKGSRGSSTGTSETKKTNERKFIKKSSSMEDWYK